MENNGISQLISNTESERFQIEHPSYVNIRGEGIKEEQGEATETEKQWRKRERGTWVSWGDGGRSRAAICSAHWTSNGHRISIASSPQPLRRFLASSVVSAEATVTARCGGVYAACSSYVSSQTDCSFGPGIWSGSNGRCFSFRRRDLHFHPQVRDGRNQILNQT